MHQDINQHNLCHENSDTDIRHSHLFEQDDDNEHTSMSDSVGGPCI